MRTGQAGRRGPHGRDGNHHGALVRGARSYELGAAIGFLGRRRRVFEGLVALSGAGPGDRVLDIGCGTGYFTRRAARAVTPGGHVVGIDPSRPVVDYATRRARANCTFQVASAQDLPHRHGAFDVVISSLAVHHLPNADRPAALREMRRVLRPGGRLFIADFRERPGHLRIANLAGMLGRRMMQHSPEGSLADLITEAGFEVTGTGACWPSLQYVQAQAPAQDARPEAPGAGRGEPFAAAVRE